MLATRIIPVLLHDGDTLLKGIAFDNYRVVGHALQSARVYAMRGVDELLYIDISDNGGIDAEQIERLTADSFVPMTVGGNIRSLDDIDALMRAGADKVLLGRYSEKLLGDASAKYGAQALVASVDVRYVADTSVHIALNVARDRAVWYESLGAGEILLQSVDHDGRLNGYDLALIAAVAPAVNIPVIASCGCGEPAHMRAAIEAGASAVAASSMFLFTQTTPRDCAEYLVAHDITARIATP